MSNKQLELELKNLIIEVLNLEDLTADDINSDTLLFGDELGLDSIDALELGVTLKKKYNIEIDRENEDIKQYFESVAKLAQFIKQQKRTKNDHIKRKNSSRIKKHIC